MGTSKEVSDNVEKVYIIILNYNGWQDTIECLESVMKSDYANYQVIVVDNCSPNHSLEKIKKWAEGKLKVDDHTDIYLKSFTLPFEKKPLDYISYDKEEALRGGSSGIEDKKNNPLILIQTGENGGFAAGNNVGIQYALAKKDCNYVWLLNNDTVIEKTSLSELVKKEKDYAGAGMKTGIIGSKLLFYDNPKVIQGVGGLYNKWLSTSKHIGTYEEDNGQYDKNVKMDYVIGASMLVCKDFIVDVGLMHEAYFLYYEEIDWIIRGKQKGWDIGYCWGSRVYHKEGGSIGTNSNAKEKSELADYYALKNKITFTKRFFPKCLFTVYGGFLVVLFNRLRRRQFKRFKMVIKILLG